MVADERYFAEVGFSIYRNEKLTRSHKVFLTYVKGTESKKILAEETVKRGYTVAQLRERIGQLKKDSHIPPITWKNIQPEQLVGLSLHKLRKFHDDADQEIQELNAQIDEYKNKLELFKLKIKAKEKSKPPGEIISVSRRTDIPAFYGDWFINRIKEGFAEAKSNRGRRPLKWSSLKPEDVSCFVFWSKNFEPFMKYLDVLDAMGYNSIFHFTITGLPRIFEPNVVERDTAIKTMKALSSRYSPSRVNWRYDPIIISNKTDADWHMRNFEEIAKQLKGHVEQCMISFVKHSYPTVKKNFKKLQEENGISVKDPNNDDKIDLANKLADIAKLYGIAMFSCCGDFLKGDKIQKATCVDGAVIEKLFFDNGFKFKIGNLREGCGCAESRDIGVNDTCINGCIYCYANKNKDIAKQAYESHDPEASIIFDPSTLKVREDASLAEIQ